MLAKVLLINLVNRVFASYSYSAYSTSLFPTTSSYYASSSSRSGSLSPSFFGSFSTPFSGLRTVGALSAEAELKNIMGDFQNDLTVFFCEQFKQCAETPASMAEKLKYMAVSGTSFQQNAIAVELATPKYASKCARMNEVLNASGGGSGLFLGLRSSVEPLINLNLKTACQDAISAQKMASEIVLNTGFTSRFRSIIPFASGGSDLGAVCNKMASCCSAYNAYRGSVM